MVRQSDKDLLGTLAWGISFAAKGALSIYIHGIYDERTLGHLGEAFPLTFDLKKIWDFLDKNEVTKFFGIAKIGGEIGNALFGVGKDDHDHGLMNRTKKKIIPGMLYCALLSGVYGGFAPALASYVITTAVTEALYYVVGEKMLGMKYV